MSKVVSIQPLCFQVWRSQPNARLSCQKGSEDRSPPPPQLARQLITSQKNPTPVSCDNVQLFSILGMQHGQPKGTAQWGIIRVAEEWPVNICQVNE